MSEQPRPREREPVFGPHSRQVILSPRTAFFEDIGTLPCPRRSRRRGPCGRVARSKARRASPRFTF